MTAHGVVDAPARVEGGGDAVPPAEPTLRTWYDRLEWWVGIGVVAACCVFLLLQLDPRDILSNTTVAGGDTGAHVWFPAYLRDHLLPWHLAGWAPSFYAGFPAGQFYFPFPALVIVALDVVLPYNVAFKLVTVLGLLLLPIGAYVFARGLRLPRPSAPLLAVGATAFMFIKGGGDGNTTFDLRIMGGTIASTLAGEYSFMIALALALFFLGTLARALDRRGPMWLPAVLLALTVTSHLVVGVFAGLGAVVIWVARRPLQNLTRTAAILVVGVLVTSVWLVPLAATLQYSTDMRYEPLGTAANAPSYFDFLNLGHNWLLYPLIAVAFAAGVWYRRRGTFELVALTTLTGLVFYNWEGLRSVVGKAPAWNLRLLPFWYLMLFLVAALGVAEVVRLTALAVAWVFRGLRTDGEGGATDDAADVPGNLPLIAPTRGTAGLGRDREMVRVVAIVVLMIVAATVSFVRMYDTREFLPYWARYNYTGYEGGSFASSTAKSWPEYRAFLDTVNTLPPGRLAWEGGDAIGAYGTPDALMMIPYWTHERIASMEGLYYEASATTPYHFMMIATLAQSPSNPVRALPYRSIADFNLGVRYLQLMGVRYYAAFSSAAKNAAARNPLLAVVATVPDLDHKPPSGWSIYRVADSPTVQALRYQPVAVDNLHAESVSACLGRGQSFGVTATKDEYSAWECAAVPWFNDPAALDRPLTDGGPADWKRATMAKAAASPRRALPSVRVSHIRSTDTSVQFDVSRTGVPVMVKTSYFPNWHVAGAEGPWRATPNFMVVVPTARHVKLTYGTTSAEWVGRALTLVGIAGLGGLVWWGWAVAAPASASSSEDRRRRRVRFPSRNPR